MSRSKPTTRVPSPIKHYFEWSGSEGEFKFYDKEKKKNILFPKLRFIVLDEMHTVSGYSQNDKASYRGTKVKNIDEPIKVWLGKSLVADAPYKALRESTKLKNLKYAKSLIIAIVSEKKPMELAELTLKGSSFGSWLDFLNATGDYSKGTKVDPYSEVGISVNGRSEEKVNGTSKYFEPLYSTFKTTEAQIANAVELDVLFQQYYNSAITENEERDHITEERLILPEVPGESEELDESTPEDLKDDYEDDLPF